MFDDSELERIDVMITQGQHEEALAALGDSTDSQDAEWHYLRARTLEKTGRREEAIEEYSRCLDNDPDHPEALFHLAYAYDLIGEDYRAVELYERCVSGNEPPVNALLNLSVIYDDHGRYKESAALVRRVLQAHPNHVRAQLFMKDLNSSLDMHYDEDQERTLEKHNALLDIPVTDFELSVRSRNCLRKMNIFSLGDLLRVSEQDLLSYANFGETSLDEIKAMLTQKGVTIGQLKNQELRSMGMGEMGTTVPPPAIQGDPILLGKTISELELSVRARKCLQRLGVVTLADLAGRTEAELLASKNFGQTSLNEIKLCLEENGLGLRDS
jgi:DNA-directed RNA polymerase subunit alpha